MQEFKRNSGFTLIELMIVVAIIAALAGIAIPTLMHSRIAANELKAVTALKAYANGQTTHLRRYNIYADDFSKLYSMYPNSPALDKAIVDANSPTATPYSGYFFQPLDTSVNFSIEFNLGAAPTKYNYSGVFIFFITTEGTVYRMDVGSSTLPSSVPADPLAAGWTLSGD